MVTHPAGGGAERPGDPGGWRLLHKPLSEKYGFTGYRAARMRSSTRSFTHALTPPIYNSSALRRGFVPLAAYLGYAAPLALRRGYAHVRDVPDFWDWLRAAY